LDGFLDCKAMGKPFPGPAVFPSATSGFFS